MAKNSHRPNRQRHQVTKQTAASSQQLVFSCTSSYTGFGVYLPGGCYESWRDWMNHAPIYLVAGSWGAAPRCTDHGVVSPDACWRDFVGGISRFGDSLGNGIVSTLRDLCTGAFFVIFDYCGAVFALGFLAWPTRWPTRRKERTEAAETSGAKSIDFRAESVENVWKPFFL